MLRTHICILDLEVAIFSGRGLVIGEGQEYVTQQYKLGPMAPRYFKIYFIHMNQKEFLQRLEKKPQTLFDYLEKALSHK